MPLPPAPTAPISGIARFRGIVLVVLGPLLFIVMCWLLVAIGPGMLHPGQVSADGTRFTGSANLGLLYIALLVSVAIAGAAFSAAGVQLLRTGVIPRGIQRVCIAAVILMIALGLVTSQT